MMRVPLCASRITTRRIVVNSSNTFTIRNARTNTLLSNISGRSQRYSHSIHTSPLHLSAAMANATAKVQTLQSAAATHSKPHSRSASNDSKPQSAESSQESTPGASSSASASAPSSEPEEDEGTKLRRQAREMKAKNASWKSMSAADKEAVKVAPTQQSDNTNSSTSTDDASAQDTVNPTRTLDEIKAETAKKRAQQAHTITKVKSQLLWEFFKQELGHVKEIATKPNARTAAKQEAMAKQRPLMLSNGQPDEEAISLHAKAHYLALTRELEQSIRAKSKKQRDAEAAQEAEFAEYQGPTAVEVHASDKPPVWSQRMASVKDWTLRGNFIAKGLHRAKAKARTSENPLLAKANALIDTIQETREDMKQTYEESQHPYMEKVRRAFDAITGETEMAFSVSQIQAADPTFNMLQVIRYMESYMLPTVLRAFLRNDDAVMGSVCEGHARSFTNAACRSRLANNIAYDETILDIHSIDIPKAVVTDNTPFLVLHFVSQQINCQRTASGPAKGQIVLGSPTEIENITWAFLLRRDTESPWCQWKICEWHMNKQLALV